MLHPEDQDHPLEAKVRELERRLEAVELSDRAPYTSIGVHGMRVVDGGKIEILDAGDNVALTLSAEQLLLAGLLSVTGTLDVEGGLIVSGPTLLDGDLDVVGSIAVAPGGTINSSNFDAGTAGYRLLGSGDAEFNSITLREGIVDLEALVGRVEAFTDGTSKTSTTVNSDSVTLNVTVPTWATDTSLIAMAGVGMEAADPGDRFTAELDIDTNTSAGVQGTADTNSPHDAAPVVHQRTWQPSGTFPVTLSWGAAPLSAAPSWVAHLAVLAVFSR